MMRLIHILISSVIGGMPMIPAASSLFYANGVMSRSPGLPSPDGYPGTISRMILNRIAVPSRPWI